MYLDVPLSFIWKGGLIVPDETWTQYTEIIYDVIMTLHTKALLHNKIAINIINAEILSSNSLIQAGKNLRIASGLMYYISTSLLPRWISSRGRINLPPECSESICLSLSHWFTAAAQIMAVNKVLLENKTPSNLIVKLCMAIINELN